jgi:hypothetical protein
MFRHAFEAQRSGGKMRSVSVLDEARRLAVTPAGSGALLAGLGFTVWLGLSVWAGFDTGEPRFRLREAWDCSAYLYVGLPVMVAAVAVAGFEQPQRVWRWPLWLVAGHQLGMLLVGVGMQSEFSLLLLTAILAIMLAAFLFIPALIGSTAARILARG